jgi:hypothetical protein
MLTDRGADARLRDMEAENEQQLSDKQTAGSIIYYSLAAGSDTLWVWHAGKLTGEQLAACPRFSSSRLFSSEGGGEGSAGGDATILNV